MSRQLHQPRQSRTAPGYTAAATIGAAITAAVALAALAGCDTPTAAGPQYIGICVDPVTNMRVDDSYCTVHPADWDYFDTDETYTIPALRSRVYVPPSVIVLHAVPAGRSSSLAVPASGGSITNIRTTIIKTGSGSGSNSGQNSGQNSGRNSGRNSGSISGSSRSTSGNSSVTRGGLGVPNASNSSSSGSGGSRISAGS